MFEYIRIAVAVPNVSVANVTYNVNEIIKKATEADKENADIVLFPELAITGYTAGDLFFQKTLMEENTNGLKEIIKASKNLKSVIAVGLPIEVKGRLYNAAAIIYGGKLYGVVPKTFIPNYNEFYERRWFSSGTELDVGELTAEYLNISDIQEESVPVGNDLVFDTGYFRFGAEVCEDIWAPIPQSCRLTLNGAEVMLNLSASNQYLLKRSYRREMVSQQSGAQICAYAYASSGSEESTTDLIFSGHGLICADGKLIAENKKFIDTDYVLYGDVDLGKIRTDRLKIKTYGQSADLYGSADDVYEVRIPYEERENDLKYAKIEKLPFVPENEEELESRSNEIFEMQVEGLKRRLEVVSAKPVIGVSGGLDSTLALLVATEAVKRLNKPASEVVGITMPCFGTTSRTHDNSVRLMKALGVTYIEIPIKEAVLQHFRDIGQDENKFDLTYENSQARERTQVLMDYAGKIGGLVVGTGDLSELALGWCTYNADHMSMYGVNSGVPKTAVKNVVKVIAKTHFPAAKDVIADVLDTPVSPELLPPSDNGKIAQQTENLVGPYELHDFYIYYTLRFGFTPEKIYALANKAFDGEYDKKTIKKWLVTFYKRFFSQQYKRNCIPDGVKIGSVSLSPRGDFRMPSDASSYDFVRRAQNLPE